MVVMTFYGVLQEQLLLWEKYVNDTLSSTVTALHLFLKFSHKITMNDEVYYSNLNSDWTVQLPVCQISVPDMKSGPRLKKTKPSHNVISDLYKIIIIILSQYHFTCIVYSIMANINRTVVMHILIND